MTRQVLRLVLVTLLLPLSVAMGFLLGDPASPAQAASGTAISIAHTESGPDGSVSTLLDVSLPSGTTPDLSTVEVEVDGHPVPATATPVEAGTIDRTTVLVIDASDSMAGDRIAAAESAAKSFLHSAPADVKVGLLTFSDRVRDVIAPTTDRDPVATAVDDIRLTRGTHLYDAVAAAVNLAGEDGARDVLLLSDGRDTGSERSLDQAAAAAKERGASVDVVTLDQSARDRRLVSRISGASGGRVIAATDPAALGGVFRAEADALASQVLVRFDRPTGGARDVDLDVSIAAGRTTYDDSAFVSLSLPSGSAPTVVRKDKPLLGRGAMLAGAAALGLGLAVIAVIALGGGGGPTKRQRLVAAYLGEQATSPQTTGLKDSAVAITEKLVKGDVETRLTQRLHAAGMTMTAAEWILLHAGVVVGAAALGLALGGGALAVLGLLLGAVLPWVFLKVKHARRLAMFAQLPETLSLMAGGLSAGLSMPQAVDTVVQEGSEPMAGELRRALVEHRLGVTVEDGLEGVADRMQSEDFRWVVMAVRIQREVGGNLSEVLNTVADTLREREYLRRQVKSLSAEGRLSGWMLGCLPVGLFGYMLLANRTYVSMLYTTGIGIAMLAAAVVLLGIGAFFMSRLVKVEV